MSAFRMTRAYQEGFVYGFSANGEHKSQNPYIGARKQEINEWNEGWHRGCVLRHYHGETTSQHSSVNDEVTKIRNQRKTK